jgi:hypothetical protein
MGPGMQLDQEAGRRAKKQLPFLTKSTRTSTKNPMSEFADRPGTNGSHTPEPQTPIKIGGGKAESVAVGNPNLEKMVEDLATKIAELTALINAQQGPGPLDDSL